MEARAFSDFLVARINETLLPLENNILELVGTDLDRNINQLARNAGKRDILKALSGQMDGLLSSFYQSREQNSNINA